jgi:HEAT repeat protein
MLAALPVAALLALQPGAATRAMQADVDRLVRAAQQLTDTWPTQPPPPIPEVALVARHGEPITPMVLALLSDDANVERDRKRFKVHQQAALALSRIYSEPEHCGRIYCDGDSPERFANIKNGWLGAIARKVELRSLSTRELLDRFKRGNPYNRPAMAPLLAARADRDTIRTLEQLLLDEDRQMRGSAALVLGLSGDPRGFATIAGILADRSSRPRGVIPYGNWTLRAQIEADRYHAAALLGDLKDPRGVNLLIPLLNDGDVDYTVASSLADIGDRRAIGALIGQLTNRDPSLRVLAIHALGRLNAREALPRLRQLLQQTGKSSFAEQTTVGEAARHAIAVISPGP